MLALFTSQLGKPTIDSEKGILSGVKVMQRGKQAQFAAGDEVRNVTITDRHIDALLGLAGNRSIVSHLTHDWYNSIDKPDADTVEMNSRVGALRNFRKDADGDLSADYVLMNGPKRDMILWSAANTPDENMISVVYDFDKSDPDCIPKDFQAADLVPEGAGTYALFKKATLNESNMDKSAFLAMLKEAMQDPETCARIKEIVGGNSATMADSEYAAMEEAAGVTDEDKKPEDVQKPALMRFAIRSTRALARMRKSLDARQDEIVTKAKAAATEFIGKSPELKSFTQGINAANEFEAEVTARMSQMEKPDRGLAIRRIAKDKPALYRKYTAQQEGARK